MANKALKEPYDETVDDSLPAQAGSIFDPAKLDCLDLVKRFQNLQSEFFLLTDELVKRTA